VSTTVVRCVVSVRLPLLVIRCFLVCLGSCMSLRLTERNTFGSFYKHCTFIFYVVRSVATLYHKSSVAFVHALYHVARLRPLHPAYHWTSASPLACRNSTSKSDFPLHNTKAKVIWQKAASPTYHPSSDLDRHLHAFLDSYKSALQMASRSVYPFLHSSPFCPRHRKSSERKSDIQLSMPSDIC